MMLVDVVNLCTGSGRGQGGGRKREEPGKSGLCLEDPKMGLGQGRGLLWLSVGWDELSLIWSSVVWCWDPNDSNMPWTRSASRV